MIAKLKINQSAITLTYTLRAGQPWIEISVQVRWLERGGPDIGTPSLKMRFPLALAGAKGRYEIPFGSIERNLNEGQEVPALRWADVTGKAAGRQGLAGCALLNDSKYGHALAGSMLTLTLLRSTYDPDPLPEIGDHTIRMAVAPHGTALPVGDLVRMGAAFNHSLIAVPTDVHKGRLPAAAAAIADEVTPNVILSGLKKAEDDESLIFHLFETAGKKTVAKVALSAAVLGVLADAVEVDLLERPVADSSARLTKGGFSVTVPAHGIAAVKVSFAG
jgi:alpha-mannosidase